MVVDKNEVIGLDVGHKRIGVARVSLIAKIPEALRILENNNSVFVDVKEMCEDLRCGVVAVGVPHNSKGETTKQSDYSKKFAVELAKFLGKEYEVLLVDESYSSVKARERFPKRKDIDDEAAAVILEHYLEEYVS